MTVFTRDVVGLLAFGVVGASASAATVTYTSEASFLNRLGAGYSFNDFNGLSEGGSATINSPAGIFAYQITSDPLYYGPGFVSTDSPLSSILITFTSGNVTAVGANIWGTDIDFTSLPVQISITLDDGTIETFSATGPADFRGFTSDLLITSMTISTASDEIWPTLDNLYVGVMVPLPPAAWAGLGLLGVIGGVRAARRRG